MRANMLRTSPGKLYWSRTRIATELFGETQLLDSSSGSLGPHADAPSSPTSPELQLALLKASLFFREDADERCIFEL